MQHTRDVSHHHEAFALGREAGLVCDPHQAQIVGIFGKQRIESGHAVAMHQSDRAVDVEHETIKFTQVGAESDLGGNAGAEVHR